MNCSVNELTKCAVSNVIGRISARVERNYNAGEGSDSGREINKTWALPYNLSREWPIT